MRRLASLAATVAVGLGAVTFAPSASAGHVVIGIGLPGIAIAVPAPFAVFAPPHYYAPAYYGRAYFGAPWYGGWYRGGYYGRPFLHVGSQGRGRGGYRYH